MTKEARIPENRIGGLGAVAFNWGFGFRHSFNIRHSGFVIVHRLPGIRLFRTANFSCCFPMTILKPPRLRRGDVIGLISPASPPLPAEKIEKGARYLERLGYRV